MSTTCLSSIAPANTVVINIDSSWFNVLNFVLFDILLGSFVFYITGDIAGLTNSASAVSQLANKLHPYNPPFVGVGLTCTRRDVYRALAFVRGLTMILVLATNFLIEGSSCAIVENARENVLVPGIINSSDVLLIDVLRLTLKRRGCQGRNGDLVYYGESRGTRGCELREELFAFPTVYFGLNLVNTTINHAEPCSFFTNNTTARHMHGFSCPGLGTIACLNRDFISSVLSTCVGIVNVKGYDEKVEAHICEGEALFPGRSDQNQTEDRVARCRLAKNLNVLERSWVPLLYARANFMKDIVDAVYGSAYEEMDVKVTSPDNIQRKSQVHMTWFFILGFTLLTLIVLISIDLALRFKGYVPVANSEFGLASLIQAYDEANEIVAEEDILPRVPESGPQHNNTDDKTEKEGETMRLLFVENHHGVLRARSSSK